MVWAEKYSEKYAVHADICNLGSDFLATNYMSFLSKSRH